VLDDALQLTGQYPYAAAPAALLAWMQEHEPDSFARTRWVLECKDWIRYKLTGEIAIDPTEASLSFTNVRTQAYDPEAFRLFGLEAAENMLPPVKGSAEIVGTVTAEAAEHTGLRAGTPVVAGLHDVDASAIGTGCIHPGQLSMTAGTFSINQIISDKPVLDGRWACRNFMRPGQWMNMSISPASATNLDWFVDNLCQDEVEAARAAGRPVYEFVNTEISAVLAEDTGVFFLPFIYGSPYGDRANAVFFGLRGWHKRGHLLRAVFEGVAFNHKMHIEALRSAFPVDEVRVTGGGSRSAIWSQIFADAFGLPVVIAEAQETGALGTAFCAGIGVGVYQSLDDAAASAVRIVRTHQPNAERQRHLAAAYKTYSEIAHALQPVWAGMQG
jgi:L-xylulokinase